MIEKHLPRRLQTACALEASDPQKFKVHSRKLQAFDDKSAKIAGGYACQLICVLGFVNKKTLRTSVWNVCESA